MPCCIRSCADGSCRFNIGSSGQQIHVTMGPTDPEHTRHPCFKLGSREELEDLKKNIHDHFARGGPAAPMAADKPGTMDSGLLHPFSFISRRLISVLQVLKGRNILSGSLPVIMLVICLSLRYRILVDLLMLLCPEHEYCL